MILLVSYTVHVFYVSSSQTNNSVGISLNELGDQMSKFLNFFTGLKFKTDFHSKLTGCRHELGVGVGSNLFNPQQFPHWTKIPSKICTTASIILTSKNVSNAQALSRPAGKIAAYPVNTPTGYF